MTIDNQVHDIISVKIKDTISDFLYPINRKVFSTIFLEIKHSTIPNVWDRLHHTTRRIIRNE